MSPIKHGLLVTEAVSALVVARALVFIIPWRFTAYVIGPATFPDAVIPTPSVQIGRALGVARRVTRLADRLPWASTCLVRALAGALLLRWRGMPNGAIRLGCRKVDGKIAAHAWLVWDGIIIMGGPEQDFQPIADLGARSARFDQQA